MASDDTAHFVSQFDRLLRELCPEADREEVRAMLLPLLAEECRLPRSILLLSGGVKENIPQYLETARQDYRDILVQVAQYDDYYFNQRAKNEKYQEHLDWLGIPRETDIRPIRQPKNKGKSRELGSKEPTLHRWLRRLFE